MSRELTIDDDVKLEIGDILVTPKGRRFHVTDRFVKDQTRGLYVKGFTPKIAIEDYDLDEDWWGWPCARGDTGFTGGQYLLVIESEFLGKSVIALDVSRFPHRCPKCGSPAYVGFSSTECSSEGCR